MLFIIFIILIILFIILINLKESFKTNISTTKEEEEEEDLVSVVIPTYNRFKYLLNAINFIIISCIY
tara:strand:- start:1104 stop:1304 length:201 start_codon:yes stop_codon:yes gene_type:complete